MNAYGNHWYHCIGSTYGSWLRGDLRGWRSRHHREHVEGDYKHPPDPQEHEVQRIASLRNMHRPQVILQQAQRVMLCQTFADKLNEWQLMWVDLCVAPTHFHLLVNLVPESSTAMRTGMDKKNALNDRRDPLPRHLLARLKKHGSHFLRQAGQHQNPGGIWGKRNHVIPIQDRNHQLSVVRYIRAHATQHAVVWSTLNRSIQNRY